MKTVEFDNLNKDLYKELKSIVDQRMIHIQSEEYSEHYNSKFDDWICEAAMELVFGNSTVWSWYNDLVDKAEKSYEVKHSGT